MYWVVAFSDVCRKCPAFKPGYDMRIFYKLERILFFCCCIFILTPEVFASTSKLSMADKLQKLEQIEEAYFNGGKVSPIDISESLPLCFEKLFYINSRLPDLNNVKKSELIDLFKAAAKATFYSSDKKYALDMLRIFQALEVFGVPNKAVIAKLYDALLVTRLIDDAKKLGQKYPFAVTEPLPHFRTDRDIPDGSATEWVVSQASRTLTRRVVSLEKGAQVIVLSHPFCHFSRNAHEAITADSGLMKVMQPHTKWLVPQSPGFVFDPIQKWNAQHQDAAMTIAYSRKEWPSIKEWSTPVFYFYKDGALVTSFLGWPKEGNMSQLKSSLKMIGLE